MSIQSQTLLTALSVYLALIFIASITAFGLYWFDKRRAVTGGRRVPENTLHWASLFGGWPGAIIAQRRLRHKTQKRSFRIVFWITVLLHCGVAVLVAYWLISDRVAPI